jgi:outer membrane protein OmpA-like peptidoglycan-associated protein
MAWGQGISTQANPNDWEEINFDFNSSVLVDGFPSLLRIAELLQANRGNRVRIEGYTDAIGNTAYNQTLGLARANSVRDFLIKYGANEQQLTTVSRGATAPRVPNQSTVLRPTDEARFMNRRVTLTATDSQGNVIGAGSAGDAIRGITGQAGQPGGPGAQTGIQAGGQQGGGLQGGAQPSPSCCEAVLKRLDKLDEIAQTMKDLSDQNAQLRRDLDALRQNQTAMQNALQNPAQTAANNAAVAAANSAAQAANAAAQAAAQANSPRSGASGGGSLGSSVYHQLAFNVGADDRGKIAGSGRGRFFAPLGTNFGVQAQGEYYYLQGQKEGQFDIGMVDRFHRRVQAGLFGSFKTVSLSGNQTSGTLGQGSFVLDYFFGRGKVGLFASKAFKDNALINRANGIGANGLVQRYIIEERYLKVVDQIGISGALGLVGNTYAEANIGYLRSTASSNRVGGTLRFVMPVSDHVAFTVEGGVNETYLPFKGTQQGRAVVGVQLGNFLRPKEYLAADHAVPMEIPRVRYEVVTRRVRTGNDAPMVDAGPDIANAPAGNTLLDGSNTYDPDGDPITYQWTQEAGPGVSIVNSTSARASFAAAAGQTYIFRLLAKDDQGASNFDRVTISTGGGSRVQILDFGASPSQISAGQATTLSWRVLNAETVVISDLGEVPATGSRTITPSATTTYVLTARNGFGQETMSTTVVVNPARFQSCFASPTSIQSGQTSTLSWVANNASGITINPGIGAVGASGSVTVSPTATTTYTLTTTGAQADACTVTVAVATTGPGGGNGTGRVPDIIHFELDPIHFENGGSTTMFWSVVNADKVTISGIGDVPSFGTRVLKPTEPTSYLLTATNGAGSVSTRIFVNVFTIAPTEILSFTVDKPIVAAPGTLVRLTCQTTGADTVRIGNANFYTNSPTLEAFPPGDTTYTCIATNPRGQTVSKSVSVKVQASTAP